jgi:UDP-N-acetylmuramate--alanine ligase
MKYFFCGIGGSGMSSLAQILLSRGNTVAGSDRSMNLDDPQPLFRKLSSLGIALFPQDGSGITDDIDFFVMSSAVEESNYDFLCADMNKKIQVRKRAEILADIFNSYPLGIAIGGTSGKTTTTGILGHILKKNQMDPMVINGGVMINELETNLRSLGNVTIGGEEVCVIEADESDGTIELYKPYISAITNISEDHKPIGELQKLFDTFANNSLEGIALNADCENSMSFLEKDYGDTKTFGIEHDADIRASDIVPNGRGFSFSVNGVRTELNIPGRHNIYNALTAITATSFMGLEIEDVVATLPSFKGIKRRLETIGITENNIKVIDDFAHNPEKIAATLSTLNEQRAATDSSRFFVIYQPHGFAPTKLTKDALIKTFTSHLTQKDALLMPEIYYAGGTAEKDISSMAIVNGVKAGNLNAEFFENREDIIKCVVGNVREGDTVIVMGARDNTLSEFAQNIFHEIAGHKRRTDDIGI